MNKESSSLRVAVVATSLQLAGAEKQTFYQARALASAGFQVHFFHLGELGHFEADLRLAGINFERIYFPNRPIRILSKLTLALLRFRPNIVIVPQFGDLRFAIPAAVMCRALVIGGIRSDGFYELRRHGRLSQWLIGLSHGLITNSIRAKRNLISQKVNPENISVIPNVIDLPVFDERSKNQLNISLPPDRIILTAVGNLHSCKRFDRFIDALAQARRTEPKLIGIIAGANNGIRAELEAQAAALGLTPTDLVFLGQFDQVPALLARSTMLILTSEYEGFPNVILEAMAARLPVITFPAGDASLIVEHRETGFVVRTEDNGDLANFIVQLAKDSRLRRKMGEAGRRRVEAEYNCEPLADNLKTAIYQFAQLHQKHSLCQELRTSTQSIKPGMGTQAINLPQSSRCES